MQIRYDERFSHGVRFEFVLQRGSREKESQQEKVSLSGQSYPQENRDLFYSINIVNTGDPLYPEFSSERMNWNNSSENYKFVP